MARNSKRIWDPVERFFSKVEMDDIGCGCWLWTGLRIDGYARFFRKRPMPATRFIYELMVGNVPAGYQLDHLCRTPRCVNPGHLDPVTPSENMLRQPRCRRTHCSLGHPMERTGKYRNALQCCICRREKARANHKKRKELSATKGAV